jgi:hypothetical protein
MSAKDKAIELVDKFQKQIFFEITDERLDIEEAKGCALIAVDEMILVLPFTDTNLTLNEYAIHLHKYLEQVKHEIEKL